MASATEPPATDDGNPQAPGLLRFITCGSVDAGTSTLVDRLRQGSSPQRESGRVPDDPPAALAAASRRSGTSGAAVDLAPRVDGLAAEREQGITIDVAYRDFATARRAFLVADIPGHEQHTRTMINTASTADVAVLLVDARRGVLTQTRRHAYLAALIGVGRIVLAVNKMDLVEHDQAIYDAIVTEFTAFAASIGVAEVEAVPVSALVGDNVVTASERMRWYVGPTLLAVLEAAPVDSERLVGGAFRLPVAWVDGPRPELHGYAGTIAGGRIATGDRVRVQPSGRESTVARVITPAGDTAHAVAGQAVTLTLRDEIDITRGEVISRADDPAEVADQFEATVVWMADEPLLPSRPYLLEIGTRTVNATVTDLKYAINVNSLEHLAAKTLGLDEIGVCNLALDRPVAFDPYTTNRTTGGFIIIDRMTDGTVGAGMLHFALRRSHNIHLQAVDVNKRSRAELKGQRPCVLWFTGLSGAGKSTVANLVEKRLFALGRHTYLLDGDNVRHGLNRNLGFTEADRVENIRRAAEVAKLMVDAGLIVLTAFISPFEAERAMARRLFAPGEFLEIHVDTPLHVAERRDVKGLYKKARAGELRNFTGIDSPYEIPAAPELSLDTVGTTPQQAADLVIAKMVELGLVDAGLVAAGPVALPPS